jgi:hypothetical protein
LVSNQKKWKKNFFNQYGLTIFAPAKLPNWANLARFAGAFSSIFGRRKTSKMRV